MTSGKKLQGIIVSDKMEKTVIVEVTRLAMHPKYKKYQSMSKRYKAHQESKDHKVGDTVIIQETRPISKQKRWEVVA